jgi:type II secretory pathway pseudopilin PulG
MAVLLVSLAVMGILMSVAMPAWKTAVQREKEAELVFRGEQYARAIGLYQRKFAGGFPASIDMLVEQRFLRRKYKDPMTKDGEFQILYQLQAAAVPGQGAGASRTLGGPTSPLTPQTPQQSAPGQASAFGAQAAGPRGGIIGVASKSTEASLRLYNGRSRYNEWQFVYTAVSTGIGAPGTAQPGGTAPGAGRPGMPTGPGGLPGQPRPGQERSPFSPGGFGPSGGPGTRPGSPPTMPGQPGRPTRPPG